MTGRMLEKIEEVLQKEKPHFVLVYGDTNSTLAGALAAKKLLIKVVHVEAGLRSFNMQMPEEINRILTDRISDVLCCPTDHAMDNLHKEGFAQYPCKIEKTGDVMQDSALFYSSYSAEKSRILSDLSLSSGNFVLATIHRAENTDNPDRLFSIIEALNEISLQMPIVLPLHPRTRKILSASRLSLNSGTIDPVGYFDMLELIKNSRLVMTDSGGLQKEAYFFGKPCITLRDETEWVELVDLGYNVIAGASKAKIIDSYNDAIVKSYDFSHNLYGNGQAAAGIVNVLKRFE